MPSGGPGVAVDGRSLVPPRTGIGVFTAALVDEWVAAGHEVTVLVTTGTDLAPGTVAAPVIPLGRPFHLHAAGYARRHRLRYFSPDSLIVPILLGRRATATVHDLAPLLHPATHSLRVRLAYRLLLPLALRRAAAVLVPSEATRRDVAGRHPRARLAVTGEGPRLLPAPADLPAGVRPPFVLTLGSLEPRKHPVQLAQAFADAAPPDWQLVVVGPRRWLPARDVRRLAALADGDRLADGAARIRLLGHVDDAVLAGLLGHAEALAYVSSYEGFGLPVLEAMAAGVPVLTTTAAALAEVAGDTALLVDLAGADPYGDGLRTALHRLLTDAPLRCDLAARGRQRARDYTWERAAAIAWAAIVSAE